jgi:hypothetical protein
MRSPGRESWYDLLPIDDIVYRQYGMFASLFGVRNWGHQRAVEHGRFRAIAPGRGEPHGVSARYRSEREGNGAVGETWVLWSELAAIDWEEEGGEYIGEDDMVYATPGPGRRRERRDDYLNGGWATLFKVMEALAEQFGADNVRLVVWFDQW